MAERNSWPRTARTVLIVGLCAALIELIPILLIQKTLGATPLVVCQSIAMSVLGRNAFSGGISAAALGVTLHTLASICAAAVYVLAVQPSSFARIRPIVSGLLFGVSVYLVMNFIVVPMTRIGFQLPASLPLWAMSVAVQIFAFGLPIALLANRLVRPQR